MASARGQSAIQELVHVKHGRKEIFGLQSNQIVKSKLRKKLRRKIQRRKELRSMLQRGRT